MQREWINDFHSKELKNNQQKASLIKSQSAVRIQEAKEYLREQKRSVANLNREENQRVKDERTLKRAKEWDSNRVLSIRCRAGCMRYTNPRNRARTVTTSSTSPALAPPSRTTSNASRPSASTSKTIPKPSDPSRRGSLNSSRPTIRSTRRQRSSPERSTS